MQLKIKIKSTATKVAHRIVLKSTDENNLGQEVELNTIDTAIIIELDFVPI